MPESTLTAVVKTAVEVSWYRWKAVEDIISGANGNGWSAEQLPYDHSFDRLYVNSMSPEERAQMLEVANNPKRGVTIMAMRTVSLDDAMMRATGGKVKRPDLANLGQSNIKQVVIVGAGLDTRAWRLEWPAGVKVFEIDTGALEEFKMRCLGSLPLHCASRHALVADASKPEQVEAALLGAGFDRSQPAVYLLEGFIGYLTAEDGLQLLKFLHNMSAPGSRLVMTVAPSPELKQQGDKEGWKLHHAVFEYPEDTLARTQAAGWDAVLVSDKQLQETYGIPCFQAQVYATKSRRFSYDASAIQKLSTSNILWIH